MKKMNKLKLTWDDGIWYSETIDAEFNVTLESGSLYALVERVKTAIYDILEVDFKHIGDIEFLFCAERSDNIKSRIIA